MLKRPIHGSFIGVSGFLTERGFLDGIILTESLKHQLVTEIEYRLVTKLMLFCDVFNFFLFQKSALLSCDTITPTLYYVLGSFDGTLGSFDGTYGSFDSVLGSFPYKISVLSCDTVTPTCC